MVVCEREVHDRPDRDHVLAEGVLDDPGALDERVGAEDYAWGWLMIGVPWNVP